ncbi:MAG TPA: hypothetical protein VJA66_05355 [Thermoanaerobaculia bacterium]
MSLARLAIFCLVGLAFFSIAFTVVAKRGLWPSLPPGALHDTDLWAGLAAGVTILFLLLRPRRRL